MLRWTQLCAVMALGVAVTASALVSGPAAAQQAAVQAPQAASAAPPAAEQRVFRPRDLITQAERQAYRQALRAASTEQARTQIRQDFKAQLRQRALARGGVLAEPTRKPANEAHANQTEANPGRPAAPPPRAP